MIAVMHEELPERWVIAANYFRVRDDAVEWVKRHGIINGTYAIVSLNRFKLTNEPRLSPGAGD